MEEVGRRMVGGGDGGQRGGDLITKPEPAIMRQEALSCPLLPVASIHPPLLRAWGSQKQGAGEQGQSVTREPEVKQTEV